MVLWGWENVPTSSCRPEHTDVPNFPTPVKRVLVSPSLQLWGKGWWWDSLVPVLAKKLPGVCTGSLDSDCAEVLTGLGEVKRQG